MSIYHTHISAFEIIILTTHHQKIYQQIIKMQKEKQTGTLQESAKKIHTRMISDLSEIEVEFESARAVPTPRSIIDVCNLVIGGGGTAGYCYMGAMSEIFA